MLLENDVRNSSSTNIKSNSFKLDSNNNRWDEREEGRGGWLYLVSNKGIMIVDLRNNYLDLNILLTTLPF